MRRGPPETGPGRLPPVRWRSSGASCPPRSALNPSGGSGEKMAKLDTYKRKRDPRRTPEPFGGRRGAGGPIFVVQRHDARPLHSDFRLERDGALASWAVPKGVPLEAGGRALAVHVEDHPLEYATFAGEIPAGQYGAGTVEIWDHGTHQLLEEKRNGPLTVPLHRERPPGGWTPAPAPP